MANKKAKTKAKAKLNGAARATRNTATVAGFKRHAPVKVLVKKNPKTAGSKAAQRFALYFKAKTVDEWLKMGGNSGDLRWDVDHKFIRIG